MRSFRRKPEPRKKLEAGSVIPDLNRDRHDKLININVFIYYLMQPLPIESANILCTAGAKSIAESILCRGKDATVR
jgi:hypothetical protein